MNPVVAVILLFGLSLLVRAGNRPNVILMMTDDHLNSYGGSRFATQKVESGWPGAIYDLEQGGRQLLDIATYTQFKGGKLIANWLPDEAFATTWRNCGHYPTR